MPNSLIGEAYFHKIKGFQNLYAHLRICYGMGKTILEQEALLHEMYEEELETSHSVVGTVRSHLKCDPLLEQEETINDFMRLFVL